MDAVGDMRNTCSTSCMRATWMMFSIAALGSPAVAAPPSPTPTMQPEQPPAYAENEHTRGDLLDLGVSLGLVVAHDVRDLDIAPAIRWFVAENFAIAAVAAVTSTRAADHSATLWSALAEPTYHVPLTPTTFAVFGMAVGAAYEHTLGTNLQVAPRLGLEFAVGRVSVVSTGFSYAYLTHSAADARDNAALVALTSALRIQLGYSVRW
jgi:hypothetical protein